MRLKSRSKRASGSKDVSTSTSSDVHPTETMPAAEQRRRPTASDGRLRRSVEAWVLEDSAGLGIAQELEHTLGDPTHKTHSSHAPRTECRGPRMYVERADRSYRRDDSLTDDITVPLGNLDLSDDAPRVALPPPQDELPTSEFRVAGDISDSIEAPSLALNLNNSMTLPRPGSHMSLPRTGDKTFDDSIAFDVPYMAHAGSASLALPSSASLAHQHTPKSPRTHADTSDAFDAPSVSLSLHLPPKANASSSLPLHSSQPLADARSGSNARLNPDAWSASDVLEAPSLRLDPGYDHPAKTCTMDAELNSHFSFPAAVEHPGTPNSPNTARADECHLAALHREWMPLSAVFTPPLHAAAFDGDAEAVKQLLASLPPREELWTDRGTPLHFAVQGDSKECVQLLLDAGLEIDAENGDGITPLMQAAVMGHEDVLVVLLDHGASIPKAFLPGSSESLLHFCVEHVRYHAACRVLIAKMSCELVAHSMSGVRAINVQDMVQGLQALLSKPEGKLLANSSRLKPVYTALSSLAEVCTSHHTTPRDSTGTPLSPGAIAATATEPEITRAKSVVDMLLQHSDLPENLPENASYDDLIQHANESYKVMETLGGSSVDTLDWVQSPENVSSMSPGAFDAESGRASSRTSKRFVFTPTANLDCSPANCSPLSVFGSDRAESCTPSAVSRHYPSQSVGSGGVPALASEGSSPILASTAGLSPSAVDSPQGGSSHHLGRDGSTRVSGTVGTPRTPSGRQQSASQNWDTHGMPAVLRGKQLRVRTRIPE